MDTSEKKEIDSPWNMIHRNRHEIRVYSIRLHTYMHTDKHGHVRLNTNMIRMSKDFFRTISFRPHFVWIDPGHVCETTSVINFVINLSINQLVISVLEVQCLCLNIICNS